MPKYLKKDNVIKEVSDSIAGAYVSAGWEAVPKDEYDKEMKKPKFTTDPPKEKPASQTDDPVAGPRNGIG